MTGIIWPRKGNAKETKHRDKMSFVSSFEGIRDQPRLQACCRGGGNEEREVLWEKTMKKISKFFSLKKIYNFVIWSNT